MIAAVALSKGALFTSVKLFTERRFGKEAVEDCIAAVSPDDRQVLRGIIPMGWYPLGATVSYMREVDKRYGTGNLALCREMGHFSAEWQLNSFHKLMLRFKPGDWLLQRGFSLWRQYHDCGTWEIERQSEKKVQGRLRDFYITDEAWCIRFGGFLERAILLTGAKSVVLGHPRCRVRGDEYCEFGGHWD